MDLKRITNESVSFGQGNNCESLITIEHFEFKHVVLLNSVYVESVRTHLK